LDNYYIHPAKKSKGPNVTAKLEIHSLPSMIGEGQCANK